MDKDNSNLVPQFECDSKGDPKKIKQNYKEIEIDDSIFDDYAE